MESTTEGKSKEMNGKWRSMPSFFRRKSEPELEDVDVEMQMQKSERPRKIEKEGRDIEHVSCWSKIFLSWISSLIHDGYRQKQIEMENLWRLRSVDDPEMLADRMLELLEEYKTEEGKFVSYVLWRVGYRMFYWDLVIGFFFELTFEALRFGGPVLLRLLVLALQDGTANTVKGYMFAVALFLTQMLSTMFQSHSRFISATIGLKYKNALSLAVFKHVLRLDQEGKQNVSNGKIVNLLSTDAQVPVELMRQWNRFICAPLVLIAGIAYIYIYVGPSVFFGVLLMALFVPITIQFGNMQTILQRKKMVQTDVRVKQVNEMMLGIKVLKLNAWEKPLLGVLNAVRDIEMIAIKKLHYYRGFMMPFALAVPNIASVVTFGAYILLDNEVTPADAFAVVSAFVIIRAPFVSFPLAFSMFSRALVSAKRFSEFFSLKTLPNEDLQDRRTLEQLKDIELANSFAPLQGATEEVSKAEAELQQNAGETVYSLVASDATFAWSINKGEIPQKPSGDLNKNKMKGGKTAEVEKKNGVALETTAVPVEAVAPFSLKNMSFQIPKGELVAVVGRIGDGKSSLISAILGEMRHISGNITVDGQIALCTQEPFIMNRTIRENILFESPMDQDRYLATLEACSLISDLKMLPASDLTEIGERGVNLSGGQKARVALARAVYAQPELVLLDDPLSAVDAHVGKHIFTRCIGNFEGSALRNTTRIFVTNQLHLLEYMDRIILLEDGQIVEQGTVKEIMARESSAIKELQAKHALEHGETAEEEIIDASVNVDISDESSSATKEVKTDGSPLVVFGNLDEESKAKTKGLLVKEEGREQGQISSKVVSSYWLAGSLNSWFLAGSVLFSFFFTEAVFLSIDSWLAFYSQQNEKPKEDQISRATFLGVYFGVTIGYFVVLMIRAVVYAAFSIEACRVLYHRLQNNVFYLPMEFFWQTPLGRVLNRLSKDTNDCDVMLPQQMQWLIMTIVRVIGVLAIIGITVPIFLVAIIPFLLMYMAIREYYRRSSVSTQRIESVLRSPIYSHLSETLHGVTILKAFRRTNQWLVLACKLIAENHRAHFAVEAIQIWLSMRLEFLGALIVLVTAICIIATNASPGLAGLALSYSLNIIVNLNMSVQTATQVESKMNAVERMIEYSDLENENKPGQMEAPREWPNAGHLVLEDVSLKYRDTLDPAIRNVSLDIAPGTKVGIAGTTGSGKSTLMVALFRLAPISSGRIFIDGVDTSTLSVHDVRSVITCIPQDPVLFTSSLRKNLDPFDLYSDEEIWSAVDKAHLRKTINGLPDGLQSQISQGGENLSVGQRQLVCIARAVLRKSKIIMMDEATASIDRETDAIIQKSMRTCFQNATLLVIAHRLETILDLDSILVMEAGAVAEYGPIPVLLQNKSGKLSSLVKAASSAE